jgi:transposase-like protein
VFALVERGGEIRSSHVANVTAKTLRPIIAKHVSKASFLMTDEAQVYKGIGRDFAEHHMVHHAKGEYARGAITTNTIESAFAILKRGVYGTYHSISEQHLHRYLSEFDFRYNARFVNDAERTAAALKGIEGKRLTYRQPN